METIATHSDLTAYVPFKMIPELVYVVDPSLPKDACVVAKFNAKWNELSRTNHPGPKRPLKEIRATVAAFQVAAS